MTREGSYSELSPTKSSGDKNRENTTELVIPAPERAAEFLSEDRIAIMLDREVASGILVNLKTKAIEQSWRPFAWATPTLSFVLIGFGNWSVASLWLSAERETAVWIDALLILNAALLCLTVRAMWIGEALSLIPIE